MNIDIETKSERSCGRRPCWIGWIDNCACEEAQVRHVVPETKAVKDCFDFYLPVTRAAA